MKILVTGAKGFVGKNLCLELKNIRDGKAKCYGDLTVDDVFEYDIDSTAEELELYCREAEFVFNLAGVNRPQNQEEFMQGNFGFASTLLDTLKKYGNKCPVMLSSSQQASLTGRFGNSEYGRYCYCPVTHKATLGQIVDLLHQFKEMPKTLLIPEIPADSFAKRLYSTYLSYLPKEGAIFDLKMNVDNRGSFTELVHTLNCGQVSINISKPGITKGEHWHHTKWEQFIVVSGHGLIQLRKEGTDEVLNYEVSGDRIQSVIMLPGYTHNIINLSDTQDLVTVMYCNEIFDPQRPDTFFDKVVQE